MKQEVVFDYPPLFDEIDRAFQVRGKRVIYAWGDRVFNPLRLDIPPQLLVHEAVHGRRQGADIAGWWRRYIAEPSFRLAEELPAHHAELDWFLNHGSRKQRRAAFKVVAIRLASPLYGGLVTPARAQKMLEEQVKNSIASSMVDHIATQPFPASPHP